MLTGSRCWKWLQHGIGVQLIIQMYLPWKTFWSILLYILFFRNKPKRSEKKLYWAASTSTERALPASSSLEWVEFMHYLSFLKLVEVIWPFQLALTRVSSFHAIDAQEDISICPSPPHSPSENADFIRIFCKWNCKGRSKMAIILSNLWLTV